MRRRDVACNVSTRGGTRMTLFKNKYRIESIRLRGWDYANAGLYFVTICTKNSECCLGEITGLEMHLAPIGDIAQQFWLEIPGRSRGQIGIDAFVVMPNHVHGIIVINAEGDASRRDVARGGDVACNVSTECNIPSTNVPTENVSVDDGATWNLPQSAAMSKISPKAGSLGAIVRSYKSAVTRWCGMNNQPFFDWQERHFDEIIRDEQSLDRIRKYIADNPVNWDKDQENQPGLWM
jgi:putative transposase